MDNTNNNNSDKKKFNLGQGSDVVIQVNGVQLEVDKGGNITAYTNGNLTSQSLSLKGNFETIENKDPEIGELMPDGTVYVGVSPETGGAMYARYRDSSLPMKWEKATKYVKGLSSHGYDDWKLPSKKEMQVLFENKEKGSLKGTFNQSVFIGRGSYWTAEEKDRNYAYYQCFKDGDQDWLRKDESGPVRAIRVEPAPRS